MYLKFPESEDCLTVEELGHLLMALGFPKEMFKRNLPSTVYENNKVSTKDLIQYCELRYFHQDLHFTVNLKSASYNADILKKSIKFVAKRLLSFGDLENVRLAFETYEEFDQRGLRLCEKTLLRTLKMCNLIISPEKLKTKLRHIQSTFREEGRIQLYEFMDLLVLCERFPDLPDDEVEPVAKTWRNIYCVDNFKQIVIPKEKKLWKIYNERYRNDEIRCAKPRLVSEKFVEEPLKLEDFHQQVKIYDKEFLTMQKKLRVSDRQIKLSRGGFSEARMSPKKSPTTSAFHSKPVEGSESNISALVWSKSLQTGTSHRCSPSTTTTAIPPSFRSVPVGCTVLKKEKKTRPLSCPSVVNKHVREETRNKVDHLKFIVETKRQRWQDHFSKEISRYIPNHEAVMERLKKEPTVPGKKRRYVRERPSAKLIRRLAEPKPTLPRDHITHCDAITMGMGDDTHAVILQRYGNKIVNQQKMKDTKKQTRKRKVLKSDQRGWNAFRCRRKPTLFERLLDDVDKDFKEISEDGKEEEEETTETGKYVKGNPEKETTEEEEVTKDFQKADDAINHECDDADAKKRALIEYFLEPRDKVSDVLEIMKEGFSRIFIEHENKTRCPDEEINVMSRDNTLEWLSKSSGQHLVEKRDLEMTDFEKYIRNPENLKMPADDVCLASLNGRNDSELRRRIRKSMQKISQRLKSDQRYLE